MPSPQEPLAPSEQTRRALIDAAITLFGREGFRGTSTRAIAQRAGTNVASIAYHFGGKEALRVACGAATADRIAAAVGEIELPRAESPETAQRLLEGIVSAFVHFLLLEQGEADIVAFMMRELTEDGPAIRQVYSSAIEPHHRAFCQMWEVATGRPAESDQVKLTVFSMIGQVLYFRIGQKIIQQRMGWEDVGEAQVRQITDVIVANLRSAIASTRESRHE